MNADNEDTPKKKRLAVTETPLGGNEMFRVRRREVRLPLRNASEADLQEFCERLQESEPDDLPFELRLALEWEAIEAELDDLGWPPPRGWYEVEGDDWKPVPEDQRARYEAEHEKFEWHRPTASSRIETGENYIMRRAERLSRPWWLGRLGEQIIQILSEPDPDRRLTRTLFFGRDRQRFADQHGHIAAVRRGVDRQDTLRENNEKRTAAAASWQEKAEAMAAEEWGRDPGLPTSQVAHIVHDEFKRERDEVQAAVTAQCPPVRLEDDNERRERKIISELGARGLLSAQGKDIPSFDRIRTHLNPLRPERATRS